MLGCDYLAKVDCTEGIDHEDLKFSRQLHVLIIPTNVYLLMVSAHYSRGVFGKVFLVIYHVAQVRLTKDCQCISGHVSCLGCLNVVRHCLKLTSRNLL